MRVSLKFRLIAELCGCSESGLDEAVEDTERFKTELEERREIAKMVGNDLTIPIANQPAV
jgi:hypothetical protein